MGSAGRRVLTVCGAFVVVLGAVVLFKRAPSPPESAVGRECHLEYWSKQVPYRRHTSRSSELPIVRLERDGGGGIVLYDGTHCVVLDENAAKRRVRVTDGLYKGTTGWVPRLAVVVDDAAKP